jgi:hypothetical protein
MALALASDDVDDDVEPFFEQRRIAISGQIEPCLLDCFTQRTIMR